LKNFTVLASTLSLTLLAAALVGCNPQATTGVEKPDEAKALLEKGQKLATVGECMSCHTPIRPLADGTVGPDFEKALLGGGNAWLTPMAGIGVSPNLTTGGKFLKGTVEEIVDGWMARQEPYLPPMPPIGKIYSKEELTAIVTYLKSVPAQTAPVPENYFFAGKTNGDDTWPMPGWMAAPGQEARIIPGNLEISIAPGLAQAFGQDLINANIASSSVK
jgi:mono/diheme cytochrome c family protein